MNRARGLLALWLSLACFLDAAAARAQPQAGAAAFRGHQLSLELLRTGLDGETVWSGDYGILETAGATTSEGLGITNQLEIVDGFSADFELELAWSRLRQDGDAGGGLAFAPKQAWAGGLAVERGLGPGSARVGLAVPGFIELELSLGYALPRFDLGIEFANVLSGTFASRATATVFLD